MTNDSTDKHKLSNQVLEGGGSTRGDKEAILTGTALTCRQQIIEDISQVRNPKVMSDKGQKDSNDTDRWWSSRVAVLSRWLIVRAGRLSVPRET